MKRPNSLKFQKFCLVFAVLIMSGINYCTIPTKSATFSPIDTDLQNMSREGPIPTNISIRIWLTTTALAPELNSSEQPDLFMDANQYSQFFIWIQVLSNDTPIHDNITVFYSLYHQYQSGSVMNYTWLHESGLDYDPINSLFSNGLSVENLQGGSYMINITVQKVNTTENLGEISANFLLIKPDAVVPLWLYIIFGAIILAVIGGMTVLIVVLVKKTKQNTHQKLAKIEQQMKKLNQKIIELDHDIPREELIKEHEGILEQLRNQKE